MGKVKGANVVVGIPSFGMVSTYFLQSRASQQFPLVSSAIDKIVLNKPIADARNEIVEYALSQGANYIFWLDDDVIAPPDSFLKLYYHNKDIINGVYWSKSNPPMPLLFRGHLEGPYWDWHVGDLIEIDAAGSGLTLVKTDVYRKIQKELGEPWYSVQYSSFAQNNTFGPNNTEDLYFYWKAKKAGYKVWADTSVQALHFDKVNSVLYGMPVNSPQANPAWEILPEGGKLIADIGSGNNPVYMRDEGKVVTFDIREDVKPDVVCDVRHLPVPNDTFDIVFSSHTLEHFGYNDVNVVLKEWVRILKVGGELRLIVPNIKHSALRILNDEMIFTDFWVLWGEQDYPKNFHGMGFTPRVLESLVKSLNCFENIEISEGTEVLNGPSLGGAPSESWNLQLRAIKTRNIPIDNITPEEFEKAPEVVNWWPMVIYPTWNEKEMTHEEIQKEVDKAVGNLKPREFNFLGAPRDRIWDYEKLKVNEVWKALEEEKDGLDSNKQVEGNSEGGNPRKTRSSRRRG